MSAAERQQNLLTWLASASLTTTRDVREEYGLARGWKNRYVRAARVSTGERIPGHSWRAQNFSLALECRDRMNLLRPLLAAGAVETHGLPSNALALARVQGEGA